MKLCQNQEGIIEKNGFFLKKRPTTLKYHNTPARVGEIENTDSTRAGKDVEQQKLSFVRGMVHSGAATLEDSLEVSQRNLLSQ